MYAKYFGFDKLPFNVQLQTDTFIYGGNARSVGNSLTKAIYEGRRLIALAGTSGIGKTALIQHLEKDLSSDGCKFVFLDKVSSRDQFINNICAGLQIEFRGVSAAEKLQCFNEAYLNRRSTANHVVVVLDNAHDMARELLRDVLLVVAQLGNESKFLQLVLIGLPTVRTVLGQTPLSEFESVYWYCLDGLSVDEAAAYIDQRLRFVGYRGVPLFSSEAVERLTHLTQGNPGLINVLCGFALLHISLENLHVVDRDIIEIVANNCMLPGERQLDESLQSANLGWQADITDGKVTGPLMTKSGIGACSSLTDRYAELGIPVPNRETVQNTIELTDHTESNERPFVEPKKEQPKIPYRIMCASVLLVLSGVLFTISSRFGLLPWFVPNAVEINQPVVYSGELSSGRKDSSSVFLALKKSQVSVASELQAMLSIAESQIAAHRLVAPVGDNALETYQGILNIGRQQLAVLNKLAALRSLAIIT